ncbi:unnamed protein product [Amoebophrya sp. A120]|nr:unnamed protein product [Amoebophrya sp. A120]|eukprot:GSA120T00009674001.1
MSKMVKGKICSLAFAAILCVVATSFGGGLGMCLVTAVRPSARGMITTEEEMQDIALNGDADEREWALACLADLSWCKERTMRTKRRSERRQRAKARARETAVEAGRAPSTPRRAIEPAPAATPPARTPNHLFGNTPSPSPVQPLHALVTPPRQAGAPGAPMVAPEAKTPATLYADTPSPIRMRTALPRPVAAAQPQPAPPGAGAPPEIDLEGMARALGFSREQTIVLRNRFDQLLRNTAFLQAAPSIAASAAQAAQSARNAAQPGIEHPGNAPASPPPAGGIL